LESINKAKTEFHLYCNPKQLACFLLTNGNVLLTSSKKPMQFSFAFFLYLLVHRSSTFGEVLFLAVCDSMDW